MYLKTEDRTCRCGSLNIRPVLVQRTMTYSLVCEDCGNSSVDYDEESAMFKSRFGKKVN